MRKNWKKLLALLLCLAMLAGLAACGEDPSAGTESPEPTPAETEPVDTTPPLTADGYNAAMEVLLAAEDLTLGVTVTTRRTVAGQTYEEVVQENIMLQGLQSGEPSVLREQNVTYYGETLPFEYLACGDKVYIDELYVVSMPTADYLAAMIPVRMVDPALYASLSGDEQNLKFGDASQLETWVGSEDARLISASAEAKLDSAGALSVLTYQAEYSQNAVDVQLTVEMTVEKINSGVVLTGNVPTDTESLVELSDVRIVDLFYRAMLAPDASTSQTTMGTTVYTVEAGALMMQDAITVNSYGSGSSLQLEISEVQDLVESGQSYQWNTTATYKDGTYRVDSDGQVEEYSLPHSQIYPGSAATTYIMEPDFLASSEFSQVMGCYLVEFTGAEWMALQMDDMICSLLYGDATLLDGIASKYETTGFSGYLSVDADTMLPVGYHLEYEGKHTIDGRGYTVALDNLVNFNLISDTAYETLTGEKLPDEEPAAEDKATPLFYHVTGPDGQELWLFGTIHIGDNRTAFLPQAVYDAFDTSDALALEYDGGEFDRLMESDEKLQQQITALYYYSDGSMITEHLDEELYEQAVDAMKATGNYAYYMDYVKTSIWENTVSNYLANCSGLSGERGVEARLEARAAEKGIEIRSVESALAQMEMLTGFSDGLQEWLLADTLSTTRGEYVDGLLELYELWCAGDEATLIEYLTDEDTAELTPEEQALYEEYKNAMESSRNADMHDVAVSYLESGETVFYAVGLAHLIGTDGLVDSLREAGYTVTRVEY